MFLAPSVFRGGPILVVSTAVFTRFILLATLLSAGSVVADPFAALPVSVPADRRDDVLRGEVYRNVARSGGARESEVVAVAVIGAGFSKVLDVITSYEGYPEFVPYFVESRVVGRGANTVDVFQRIDIPLFGDRHFRLRYTLPEFSATDSRRAATVRWGYIRGSGNIVSSSGSWTFVEIDASRTLVAYRGTGDIGVSLPRWLMNVISRRAVPGVINAMRARAGAPTRPC